MKNFEPGCLATAIGSMPHTDPQKASALVAKYLPHLPAWPQLPRRSFLETMYVQFTHDLPGAIIEGDRIYVDLAQDIDEPLRKLLRHYEEKALDHYALKPDYAAGFYAFLSTPLDSPRGLKGQITGPISCGLSITDQERRPILYNDIISDALAKHLRLKAMWQERKLRSLHPSTMLWVDEPYMSAFGSAFFSLSREQVVSLLGEVLAGIEGLKGVHCCGNTDWSVLLSTPIDVLSYDAYSYARSLSLYPEEVKAFLDRGGVVAWGIVPNDPESLAKETASSLQDRLEEEALAPLTRKGIPFRQLIRQGLVTPSCGLTTLTPDGAVTALELLAELSRRLRSRYS